MKLSTILFAALLCPLSPANAQSQQAVRVVEFCPAPANSSTHCLPLQAQ